MTTRDGGVFRGPRRWFRLGVALTLVTAVVGVLGPTPTGAQQAADGTTVAPAPESWPAGDVQGAVAGSRYHPVSPTRIFDTRDGTGGVPVAKVGAGGVISPVVVGVGGVPASGVTSVLVNVTAVGASAQTFVTVWPFGETRPLASNLNVAPGWVVPNLVVAKVGSGGKVSLYNNSGQLDLLGDVVGWYGPSGETSGALHHGLTPARIVDTRDGTGGVPVAKVGAGGSISPKVTGVGGVPSSGVSAVVVNVTAVGASAQTFVTVWPFGETRPLASNLNVAPGWVIPNLVVAKVGSGGKISLYNNSGQVDLLADVVGWFGESGAQQGAAFTGLSPSRIVDTREGIGVPKAKVGGGGVISPTVTGVGGVPSSGVSAVVLNVTAVGASAQTFVTVWPYGETRPLASNLNVAPGWVIPNLVVAKVGTNGRISMYSNSGTVDLLADVVGWYGPETQWSAARQVSYGSVSANLLDEVSATDAAGNVHVAWRESSDLLYRKLDSHGNTLVQTVRTGFTPMSSIGYGWRHVSIAVAPDGTVAIAWYYPGSNPGIYVATLDGGGRVASAPVRIRSGSWAYLSTAFDASGAWHLTARESTFPDSSAPSNRVFYGRFTRDQDGFTPLSAWVPVADLVGQGRAIFPAMAVQADGTAHITWFDNRRFPVSGRYDVYYTRIGANGLPSVSARRMSDVAGGFVYVDDAQNRSLAPAIDVDAAGRATLAWVYNNVDVYLATVQADGSLGLMGTKVDLGAYAIGGKGFGIQAHLEADGSTSLLLPVGNDSSSTLVQAAFDATGATKLAPVALPLGTGSWRYPSLTVVGGEQRVVVARNTNNTTRLYLTSTAALGDPVDRPDLLVDDAHSTDASSPSPPREGTVVTMTVQVTNAGWVSSPATTARFSYGATQLGPDVAVPALAVEQTALVSASWTVPVGLAVTPAAITVRVDPAGTIAETTEANNAVDHLVPVRLRPDGVGITAVGWDETADPTREGNLGVLGFGATLAGTVAGGGAFTKTVSAPAAANLAWFGEVPPGTYTLTGSAAGYGGPAAVPVTITRDAGDPYVITVAWGAGGTGSGPQLWFNRWGSITGTVTSGGPLGGVKVTEREQGLTATTAADGSYTLPKLAAGVHHLTFTRDGYGRVQDVPATVTVGSPVVVNQGLAPTTVAYVDVTVTNDAGTGLPAATVELLPGGGGAAVASCTTGGDGTCGLQPPGGTSYRVRATKAGYVTTTGPAFSAVAGRASPQSLSLALDVGTLSEVSTGPRSVLSWVQHEYVPFGGEVWVFWGNYVTDLSITHQNVGGTEYLRSLDIALDGNPFYVELMKNTVSADIGGPYAVQQIPVLTTNTASEATNVRVDAVRVYDRLTGTTFLQQGGGGLFYSHSATADAGAKGYTLDAGVDWANVVVTIDVRVGKAVAGAGGAAGWVSSPILSGWRSDVQRITWVPAENAMTVAALLG